MNWKVVVALCCQILVVLANTEQLRFTVAAGRGPRTPQLRSASAGSITPEENRIKRTVHPLAHGVPTEEFFIADLPPGTYEARVCWPASEPTAFDMQYDSHLSTIQVSYKTDFYSQYREINESPLAVNYELIVERLVWFGLVPKTVADIIKSVAAAAVVGYYLTQWVLSTWFGC